MSTLLLTIAASGALVATVAIVSGVAGHLAHLHRRRRHERAAHAAYQRMVTHQQRDRYQPGADERDVIGGRK